MNKVIRLSKNTTIEEASEKLSKIIENHKDMKNFQYFYDQAVVAINELVLKAKSVSSTETTIYIEKELVFNDLKILLILDSADRQSVTDKLKKIFRF